MVLEKVGVLVVITNRSGWLLELLTELKNSSISAGAQLGSTSLQSMFCTNRSKKLSKNQLENSTDMSAASARFPTM